MLWKNEISFWTVYQVSTAWETIQTFARFNPRAALSTEPVASCHTCFRELHWYLEFLSDVLRRGSVGVSRLYNAQLKYNHDARNNKVSQIRATCSQAKFKGMVSSGCAKGARCYRLMHQPENKNYSRIWTQKSWLSLENPRKSYLYQSEKLENVGFCWRSTSRMQCEFAGK